MWFNNLTYFYGDLGKRTAKKLARFENNLEWQNTFVNLVNLATYRFEWEGLPDTCNERFLELSLLFNGKGGLFNTEYGLVNLFAAPTGQVNINGEFLSMHGYGWNGYSKEFSTYVPGADNTNAESVICRDNNFMYPYINYIIRATERLMSSQRALDVAAKKLKNPYFISCDQSQKDSVMAILNDVDENVDRVVTSTSLHANDFQVFPTSIDSSILGSLWEHYYNLDNMVKTILGVPCETKQSGDRERLLTGEVEADLQNTDLNLDMRLREREAFCERCNDVFGTSMSVKIREVKTKEREVTEDEEETDEPMEPDSEA